MRRTIVIHPDDNVAVALASLAQGTVAESVELREDVPAGHKFALRAIAEGAALVKFGCSIGRATRTIHAGEHVHTHNVSSDLHGDLEAMAYRAAPAAKIAEPTCRTFMGYRRVDGRVATRNEIWVIPTVGCVNHTAQRIVELARQRFAGVGIDGIHAFTHPFGCSQLGGDLVWTQKVLAGLANHPNAGGVLLVGLGCENNQMRLQLEKVGAFDPARLEFFCAQDVPDEFEAGAAAVGRLIAHAASCRREPISMGELIIGMKCGGSDGLSGITANPLVGRVADLLCAAGGTVVLTEVPEMFGAEHVLLERAADEKTLLQFITLCNDFRAYFRSHNQPIDENPAPGNKAGGLTTNAEKSLGCVQKGGGAPVRQVLRYGEPAGTNLGGVVIAEGPGNDGVSGTALTVAGAHLILFTTGRGNPMGFPAPTVKVSTNTDLAKRKPAWIDFDAGRLVSEEADPQAMTNDLLDLVLKVASGQPARNEVNGNREIAIWKTGVTV